MFRYPRTANASTSIRTHHQRWISEPSTSTTCAVVTGVNAATNASTRPDKFDAVAACQQIGAGKTTRVSGRYQKNRSSTLDRDTKTTAASKPSLSSTLQQIGHWARRSFRGGGKDATGRRPKSLNDYVMTEVSSGVVVERKPDKLSSAAASRDQSPVTSSSGYASGGDGVYCHLPDENFEDFDGRHLGRQMQRGASRGSRRYRRRASVYDGTVKPRPPPTPTDQNLRLPSASALTTDKKYRDVRLPVYENLLSEALGLKCETKADPIPVSPTIERHRRPDALQQGGRINPEVDPQPKPITTEGVVDTGNGSIDDYLLPTERSSFVSSSDASTLRRTGHRPSPVYVNANVLMTSLNQSARPTRSQSLSSPRNRTLTDDQSTTFNFGAVQQRLSFTPSFVSRSPSPPDSDAADVDWDDRLSTLSLGCRRAPVSPDRRNTAQRAAPRQRRTSSARRRLLFGSDAMTSLDRRPEAVEEGVRPLFRQTEPPSAISNVAAQNAPVSRSTGLFPRLQQNEESIYETINDVVGRSRLLVSRVAGRGLEVDSDHVYDNIDDFLEASAPTSTDIHELPPPVPPPPLPARRPTAANEMPLCRSEVIELDSQHVYTIADVLDSFEALAAHLPRAQQFIYDLQAASYLHRRRQVTAEHTAESGRERRTVTDAEGRWKAAAAKSRDSANHQQASATAKKNLTRCSGPAQRLSRHSAAMYSCDESQPIVVEDYVCSPGNHLSSERPRRTADKISTDTVVKANPTHGNASYIPMKAASKPSASSRLCCGGRDFAALDGRPTSTFLTAADAGRKPNQATNKTSKDACRVSRSITELHRYDDVVDCDDRGEGRRSSRLFQMPPSFIDASSYVRANSKLPRNIARHQKVLSRSLVDGISNQSSRPTSANVADRKQNSRMTSSTFAVDMAKGRSSVLPDTSSDDLAADLPYCAPRSASEHRETGTGNSSRVRPPTAVGDGHRANYKSTHRSRASDRTSSALSRSLMAASSVPQHPTPSDAPTSSSTSFHELPPQCNRRRSSILQWTAASCSGREIFC